MNIKKILFVIVLISPIGVHASCKGLEVFNSTENKSFGNLHTSFDCDEQAILLTTRHNNLIPSTTEIIEKGKNEVKLMCLLAPEYYGIHVRSVKIKEVLKDGEISNAFTIYCNEVLFETLKKLDSKNN
ncbi:hypothetical protein [Shewanella baltica]|uniref:hypothetical protein n=1 Tax=Shewanella baltica TaxID=62322 RepID=UPI0039AFB46B